MNRRKFFGMGAAGVAAAPLIASGIQGSPTSGEWTKDALFNAAQGTLRGRYHGDMPDAVKATSPVEEFVYRTRRISALEAVLGGKHDARLRREAERMRVEHQAAVTIAGIESLRSVSRQHQHRMAFADHVERQVRRAKAEAERSLWDMLNPIDDKDREDLAYV